MTSNPFLQMNQRKIDNLLKELENQRTMNIGNLDPTFTINLIKCMINEITRLDEEIIRLRGI
jgi:hypothetical protein